ncbi:MAG: GNAT family N-acetyltransferase [Verrucomicrobia bacterium]|nr:GNAT family N-acetyltransferase [Verrucomicrobiota bacterium]
MIIRKMKEEDRARAVDLLAQWNMAPVQARDGMSVDPACAEVPLENTFVAEEDGRLVGVASYIVHASGGAETAFFAVDRAYRGRGIGEALQHARLKEMKARGIQRVRTEADRPDTIAWYLKKFPYRRIGTKKKITPYSLPDVDEWTVLVMELKDYEG